eukprot:11546792-Ditylum_brightwellii.AAC.2
MTVNSVKFDLAALKILHQTKVYIRQDSFKATETASPGFIMYQHLTITRKDQLHDNIAEYLETVNTMDNPMI